MSFPFSIYYAGDAYSTDAKIMGRQTAGREFLNAVARWPAVASVNGVGPDQRAARQMADHLQRAGFRGQLGWSSLPDTTAAQAAGVVYFPAPPWKELASLRDSVNPSAFSIMGVTHTLSSSGVADQVAGLLLPPFRPWDCLICTSQAAREWVESLHADMRDYWGRATGASRFNTPVLPVIPLGVDAAAFSGREAARPAARSRLGLHADEIVFLFAGRLSFHAKANPVPLYIALQRVAQRRHRIVLIEAGIHPNADVKAACEAAQASAAPDVRFIHVLGANSDDYRTAWQAADVFTSLSDNLQETFGLTPLEAMASGLPVVVSDWNGYKDTVRDGVDGFRVPVFMPQAGVGEAIAQRYAMETFTYDRYVGHASMSTAVDVAELERAILLLAENQTLRREMGQAGRQRVVEHFDWGRVLQAYGETSALLNDIRRAAGRVDAQVNPTRADPFHRFAHFGTVTLQGGTFIRRSPDADRAALELLFTMAPANYVFQSDKQLKMLVEAIFGFFERTEFASFDDVRLKTGIDEQSAALAVMWLCKFGLLHPQR